MKKTTFCAVFLALLSFSALAQDGYHSFPTTNAVWSQDMTGVFEPLEFLDYTCGDTIFGDKVYMKIFSQFSSSGSGGVYLQGGLREEGKQILFYKVPENVEFLLYDFSLQVGDTLEVKRIVDQNIQPFTMRVLSIDSITLTDGLHKRWKMKNIPATGFHETWIEGIGSTFGLLNRTLGFLGGTPPRLNCTRQNGETIYTLPNYSPCNFTLWLTECQEMVAVHAAEIASTVVFPNPFSDQLNVSMSAGDASTTLRLFDCFGKLLRSADVSGQTTFTWQRDDLPAGIYFLKVENQGAGNGASVLKVIAL